MLEKLVRKKLQRGKEAAVIAEELEVELDIVEKIMKQIGSS